MFPYGRQTISQDDIDAVTTTLKSDWLTQGPIVEQFEQALCQRTGASFAACVNSATSALHIACLALDISAGDIVWTSAITFVASANCARYCGADIDLLDVDPSTGLIDIEKLTAKLSLAKASNCLPKAVIVVHFAGQSADMVAIKRLSTQYGFKIIEDASHALGAAYNDKPVGNAEFSDICVFSFHPVKMVTTAEGGAALTNNKVLAKKLALYRSHGIEKIDPHKNPRQFPPWYYEQIALGYNYRMPDLNAALGLSQLTRLDKWVEKRNAIANRYNQAFSSQSAIEPLSVDDGLVSSFHLYVIKVPAEFREPLFINLRASGIGVQVHYIPLYKQPDFQQFNLPTLEGAESYYQQCISLPIYPNLSETDQTQVIAIIQEQLALLYAA